MPAFMKHVPVLGGVLRNICVRAAKRMVEVRSYPGHVLGYSLYPNAHMQSRAVRVVTSARQQVWSSGKLHGKKVRHHV